MGIADELITRGWQQGYSEDPDTGRVCLAGAASYALFGHSFRSLDADETIRVLTLCNTVCGAFVGTWNDAPERTFDEVLRVAKKADEMLDAGSAA